MAPSRIRQRHGFRPDLEGLRGLAVVLVVLYHAGLGVAGGFVGVDVFFVLSGFLITGLLLRERRDTGRVAILAFYARRVRRLVPAAVVVLLATVATTLAWLDPLSRVEALVDAAAAALSVGNIRFALVEGDYFATGGGPSPFLQFWSLGVEEQFYLAWPLLLLAAFRSGHPRLAAGAVLVVVAAASFAANVLVTDAAPAWGFYSLPTRAWQLALGGLLAVAAAGLARVPWPLLALVGWAGLGAIGAAAFGYDARTLYPGLAALAPTLGAAGLIAGGQARGGPGRLLVAAPTRFLGRISYSLYLWHWPLLVLVPAALGLPAVPGEPSPPALGAGLALGAVALATATCLLVEEPFRFGGGFDRPRQAVAGRTVSAGIAAVVAVAMIGVGLSASAAGDLDRITVAANVSVDAPAQPGLPRTGSPGLEEPGTAEPAPPSADGRGAGASTDGGPDATPHDPLVLSGPAAADGESGPRPVPHPDAIAVAVATPTPIPTPAESAGPGPPAEPVVTPPPGAGSGPGLPAGLQPPLALAATDEERLKADRCIAYESATAAPECAYGPAGAFTVALVGDSHASHWFPALEAVAAERGWRIVPFVKVSCPFIDMPVRSNYFKREYTECAAFRESTIARLATLRPDLTIVALNKWVLPLHESDGKVATVGAALARSLARLAGQKVILVDTPHAKGDVPTCLAAHPSEIGACATQRSRAMFGVGAIEEAASARSGVPAIDLRDHVCVADPCPAVVDGMIVYRDHHHLTATYSRSLAPALGALLDPFGG